MANQTLTFTLEGRDRLSKILDGAGNSAGKLQTKLALATAAIPAAAALAPLVAQTGAAAVAVAAFGLAVIPQIGALSDASTAQKKYTDAVEKSGARSEEAISAQVDYERQMAKLPPATREAAVALSGLKDEFNDWSDALAADTMPVFTKGVALASVAVPKLTPLVKGASVELDRLMTLAGGGMASPGFDRFMTKLSDFATKSLHDAVDGVVHLTRVMSEGDPSTGIGKFMDYARQQGPLVAETLRNIAAAAINVLTAAANSGVGVLQLANALAKVVAAMPPEFVTFLLQASLAIRAVTLAIAGVKLAAGAWTLVRTQITAAAVASIGAGTAMGSLRLAFMALSLAARTAVVATGIGALVLALVALSNIGRSAPPDVDKLTTSLGKLGQTGKVTGEAARVFGSDLSGLADSLRVISRPDIGQGIDKWIGSLVGIDTREIKDAKAAIDGADKSLAALVKNGNPELARAALADLSTGMGKNGMSAKELNAQLDDYKAALADAAYEQKLAADSMGLFGRQAQTTQEKLDAQKSSADGLRQAIQALNDVQRGALGGQNAFESAIDAGTKAIEENGKALHMRKGQLDLNSEAARNEESALRTIASSTDEYAASVRESGGSWNQVKGIYDRGRQQIIDQGHAMGLAKDDATKLADRILTMPTAETFFKGNIQDLDAKIKDAQAHVNALKQKTPAELKANGGQLQKEKEAAQKALDALKQKKVAEIRAHDATGPATASARGHIAGVKGKTVTLTINEVRRYTAIYNTIGRPTSGEGGQSKYATGGLVGFPGGGPVRGPGTGTSDSILARVSNGEYVIPAKQVQQYGTAFFDSIRSGQLGTARAAQAAPGRSVGSGVRSSAGTPTNVYITIEGALDPIAVGKQIQKLLLQLKRTNGANVNLLGVNG